MTERYEPTLSELAEQARILYIGLGQYRVSTRIEASEVETVEDAQKAAVKVVEDIDKIIRARKSQAEGAA